MAGDRNHYEMAFSGLLVDAGIQAMAVDETRRPVLNGIELKNFDFLVNGSDAVWALDLKGRRDRPWITRTDLFSMMGWATLLGASARPGFLFSFFRRIDQPAGRAASLPATVHETPGGVYCFCVLPIEQAQRIARPRSEKWGTFGFEWQAFAGAVLPLDALLPLKSSLNVGARA
jgi:hypothetical protein